MKTVLLSIILRLLSEVSANFEDSKYWTTIANEDLQEALSEKWNVETAKNVILFVGDGMSIDTISASRIHHRGEKSYLAWEKLPHVGLLKTYTTDKRVPDSAATATAMFCGVKTNYNVVGVDINVKLNDCNASLDSNHRIPSIIDWAQRAGKATGFVTTTRVTHATPAPLYAHSPNRRWECESTMPKYANKCKDIARQLIEDSPGRNINVILGGGRQVLQSNVSGSTDDPIDTWACYSRDGRDLIADWKKEKKLISKSYRVIKNNRELHEIEPEKVEFLLGIFANGHLNMDWQRKTTPEGQPSLEDMTIKAIQVLNKSKNGFLLVVEGGLIDFAHHRGHAAQALRETIRFSDAINATLGLINPQNTLVIVTSDHSHSMAFNGYSERNSSILGVVKRDKCGGVPYTTLTYGTGGPNNMAYENDSRGRVIRSDPTDFDTLDFNYSQQAAIICDEAYHGGGDVPVYAQGPYAHLLHSTHEQNYVAHVIGYAAKIGPYSKSNATHRKWSTGFISVIVILLFFSLCRNFHSDNIHWEY